MNPLPSNEFEELLVKTILVLGGAGAMGQIAAQDLADTAQDCEIIIGDFNIDKVSKRVEALLKRKNVHAEKVNIKEEANLVALIKKADCVINSTPYYFNTLVMKAALEGDCHYLDLGGLYHMTKEQLPMHDQFKGKNLIAVAGMGATPGTTNVLTEAACRELDKVESIDIACGGTEFVPVSNHPFDPPYMLDTMLDEYTKDAMVFENGKMHERSPLLEHKTIEFPEPVGSQSAIYTLHSELATMPENYKTKGVKGVTFRLALPKELHEKFKLFCELGFGGTDPVTTPEGTFTPRILLAHMISRIPSQRGEPDDCEILLIDVKGSRGGNEVAIRMQETAYADKERKISAGDLNTGVPPSIVAQMIVRGDVKERGVLPPELCIDPEIYFEELKKRNLAVSKSVKQAISS